MDNQLEDDALDVTAVFLAKTYVKGTACMVLGVTVLSVATSLYVTQ